MVLLQPGSLLVRQRALLCVVQTRIIALLRMSNFFNFSCSNNSDHVATIDGDELSLATLVADGPDPALSNPELAIPAASAIEMSGLTVPSEMVLPPLTTKWDKTKYLEKRVHMGIEYRKCNQCGLSKKRFNAAKALLHVCKEFGKYQHVSILTATILPVYLNQSKVEKLSIMSTSYKLKKVWG